MCDQLTKRTDQLQAASLCTVRASKPVRRHTMIASTQLETLPTHEEQINHCIIDFVSFEVLEFPTANRSFEGVRTHRKLAARTDIR